LVYLLPIFSKQLEKVSKRKKKFSDLW